MNLETRISRLKNMDRSSTLESCSDSANDLKLRIERLRAKSKTRNKPVTTMESTMVAQKLGARMVSPGVMMIEKTIPLSSRHGNLPLTQTLPLKGVSNDILSGDLQDCIFIDTETTGLSTATGTLAFLVGIARVEGQILKVRQFLLTEFAGENKLYDWVGQWLSAETILVSYNGKCFDLPLMESRCKLLRQDIGLGHASHLDLLFWIRRFFSRSWSDCKLTTAERRLLSFTRVDDTPGALAPRIWSDFIRTGRMEGLNGIVRHNLWDVVSMVGILGVLCRISIDPREWQADLYSIAKYYNSTQQQQRAIQLLENHNAQLNQRASLLLAMLYRKNKQWSKAKVIWEALAVKGCQESLERLAKYHEHKKHDYPRAMQYANQISSNPMALHRLKRLHRKMVNPQTKIDF